MLTNLLTSMACGFAIQLALSVAGQRWARTLHVVLSYLLLPAITYCVASIIAGDISLSLGMVGALSIVRFRNPVKSPLELVIYFCLITIGIAFSVEPEVGMLLTIVASVTIIFISFLRRIFMKREIAFFATSFQESDTLYFLEFHSKIAIESKVLKNILIQHTFEDSSTTQHIYRLEYSAYELAEKFLDDFSEKYGITNFRIIRN
jgi:hypothetical protein